MPSNCLDIVVYNPSTGIYKHVEVADLASPMTSNTFGLGFDAANDDYKVVRIIHDSLNHINKMDVMVYSLKMNSWRQAKNSRTIVSFPYHQGKEVSVIDNHLLHWIIETTPSQLEIACFDICNEIWTEDIVWPYSLVIGSRLKPQLGVLDGCLYVIFKIPSENKLDIWVMKEYGVNESWMKLFEISNQCLELPVNIIYDSPWRLKLLCYTNKSKDEISIWDDGLSSLIWFDLKNNNVKSIKMIRGFKLPRLITSVYLCNGSLVNIPGGRPLQINKVCF
uniref:F-box associated beta-propeller type 1 domain-containing protein n=1 Tax=Chenopodium quinoa TaxID=63459 RepID=A0A803MQE4_CHEQI